MTELNPEVVAQLEACLAAADRAAIETINQIMRDLDNPETKFRSVLWAEVAKRFRSGMHKTPACFHLHLYEQLADQLSPALRITPCQCFDEPTNICSRGHDTNGCMECPDYERGEYPFSNFFDCHDCPFKCEYGLEGAKDVPEV